MTIIYYVCNQWIQTVHPIIHRNVFFKVLSLKNKTWYLIATCILWILRQLTRTDENWELRWFSLFIFYQTVSTKTQPVTIIGSFKLPQWAGLMEPEQIAKGFRDTKKAIKHQLWTFYITTHLWISVWYQPDFKALNSECHWAELIFFP